MSGVIPYRVPWTRQPPEGTSINLGHPLASGLKHAWSGTSLEDLGPGNSGMATLDTGATQQARSAGLGYKFGGAGTQAYSATIPDYRDEITVVSVQTWDVVESDLQIAGSTDGAVCNYSFLLAQHDTTAGRLRWRLPAPSTGSAEINSAVGSIVAGKPYVIVGTYNGAQMSLAIDGSLVATAARTGTLRTQNDFDVGGGSRCSAVESLNGVNHLILVYDRGLTDAEAVKLSKNPWQIFQPQTRFLPVGSPAASTTYGVIPIYRPQPYTSSRHFDAASTEYLNIDEAALNALPATLCAWFRKTTGGSKCIVNVADLSGSSNRISLAITSGSPYYLEARHRNTDAGRALTTVAPSDNTWHHGIATFTASDRRDVYLDNGATGSNTVNETNSTALWDRTRIGRFGDSTPNWEMDGDIAHVAIYNVVISAASRAQLAAGISPLLVERESLVFYAPLDSTTGDWDIIGNRKLDVTGTPEYTKPPPKFKPYLG